MIFSVSDYYLLAAVRFSGAIAPTVVGVNGKTAQTDGRKK